MSDILDEVLDMAARRKRGQIARRNKTKLQRAKKLAERKPANEAKIKKRAYAAAREAVRIRYAGKYGENYSELSTTQKIAIDRAIADKEKLIKKLAKRLIPKIRRKDHQRLQSFMKGHALQNNGAPEGNTMKEETLLDAIFFEAFKDKASPKKSKKNYIQILGRFDNKTANSLSKKADKSGFAVEDLAKVYTRGLKMWTEETGKTPEQYAFDRVNSFISGGAAYFEEGTYSKSVTVTSPQGKHTSRRISVKANSSEQANKLARQKASRYGRVHDVDDVNEETINELSQATKDSYRQKAKNQLDAEKFWYNKDSHEGMKRVLGPNDPVVKNYDKQKNTIRKREAGLKRIGEENLQELSKKVLVNYTKNAHGHVEGDLHPSIINGETNDDKVRKFVNRKVGIQRANDKIEGNNFAKVSAGDIKHHKKQETMRKIIESGNSQSDPKKRLVGTDELTKAFKRDTPGQITEARNTFKHLRKPIKNHPHQDFIDKADHIMSDESHLKPEDKVPHRSSFKKSNIGVSREEWIHSTGKKHEKTHNVSTLVSHQGHIMHGPDVERPMREDNKKVDAVKKLAKKHGFVESEHSHILNHPDTGATLRLHKHDRRYYTDKYGSYHLSTPHHHFEKKPVSEAVKTADKAPVVVPTHKDEYGNVIPAKTVMRKKNKLIIKSGNVHDGDTE